MTPARKQIISNAVAALERAAGILCKSGSAISWSDRLELVEEVVLGQAWEGPLLDRIDQLENHINAAAQNQGFAGLAKAAGVPVGTIDDAPHHNYRGVTGGLMGLYELGCG